jgi:hypothetical protein
MKFNPHKERVMIYRCSPSGKFHHRIMTQAEAMRWCNYKAKQNWHIMFPYDPADTAEANEIMVVARHEAKRIAEFYKRSGK